MGSVGSVGSDGGWTFVHVSRVSRISWVSSVSRSRGHIGQQQQPGAPVCVIYHGELEGRGGKKKQKYFTEYC